MERLLAKFCYEYPRFHTVSEKRKYLENFSKRAARLNKNLEVLINGFILLNGNILSGAKESFEKIQEAKEEKDLINIFALWGLGLIEFRKRNLDHAGRLLFMADTLLSKINNQEGEEKSKRKKSVKYKTALFNNTLGDYYLERKEYELANEKYEEALKDSPTFSDAFVGLGNVVIREYTEKKKEERDRKVLDIAMTHYHNATKADKMSTRGFNGLGVVYYWMAESKKTSIMKKRYLKKAKRKFEKATILSEDNGLAIANLAFLQNKENEFSKSEENYRKAYEIFKEKKDEFYSKEVEGILLRAALLSEYGKEMKGDDLVKKVLRNNKLQEIAQIAKDKEDQLKAELKKPRNDERGNYFQVLRRWNSFTPILAESNHISMGGGYFLKCDDKGIVVDPGINFLDNFKSFSHRFDEIDYVFVSHAHNDHTADIESILVLLNEFNEPNKDDQEKEKDESKKEPKKIEFFMSLSVFKKYSGSLELGEKQYYQVHIVEPGNEMKLGSDDRAPSVKVLASKHDDIISDRDSLGFCFNGKNCRLIYTGDTGWNRKMMRQYTELHEINTPEKYTVLLAHLGGFKDCEYEYLKDEESDCNYKNHLGRIGLTEINRCLRPDICVISEFGEEMRGGRIKIANEFQKMFKKCKEEIGKEIKFIPADIGLKFYMERKKINGIIYCGVDEKIEYGCVDANKIEYEMRYKDYSIHYYAKEEKLDKGLMQYKLSEEWNKDMSSKINVNGNGEKTEPIIW